MTDAELIARLEEAPPEEWSVEELDLLRARAAENPEVRAALVEQIWLEQTLVRGLGRPGITADQVLARLDQRRRGPLRFGPWLRAAAVLLFVVGVGGIWWKLRQAPPEKPIVQNRPSVDQPAPLPPRTSVASGTKPKATASPTPGATAMASVPVPSATATAGTPTTPEPWTPMLAAGPVPFDMFWSSTRRLSRDVESLQRWWETKTGQQRPVQADERFGLQLGGLFELRSPWSAGTTLTLWTTEVQSEIAKLHLWNGDAGPSGVQGVTLELRQRPYEHWTAYQATKQPAEPLPQQLIFATGDNDRARRTGEGPIDLRWHEGRVWLSRGDILLLTVPLAAPPQSVWFEGTAVLKGIGLAQVEGMPIRWTGDDADRPNYFELSKPVDWPTLPAAERLSELPAGATVTPHGDEGMTLTATDTTKPSWAAFRLPQDGFYDLVCEVEQADPQTGVYLGDEKGYPRHAIGFYEYQLGQPLHVSTGRPTDLKGRYKYDARNSALPTIAFPGRLRLLCGAGTVKVFGTVDGQSWGRIMEPIRGVDGHPPTLGVYCAPGKGKRSIKLSRVRCETRFTLDKEVLAAVPPMPEEGGFGMWLVDVLARPSQEADDQERRLYERALALLVKGVPYEAARTMVGALAISEPPDDHDDLTDPPSIDFTTLCLLADTYDGSAGDDWYDFYLQSGVGDGLERMTLKPLERCADARLRWMEMPLQSAARWPFLPPELIRDEIFDLLFQENWDDLDQYCRVLHFYGGRTDPNARRQPHREPIMELVDWAAALAERRRSVPEGQLPVAPQTAFKPEWRHPLIEQFGKEGYNVLAELEIALQEKAYADACRIITGVTAVQAVGLLPNAADGDLLVSLPGAVALAMRTHPELRAVMQREYGELAQLRFRQASADGEVDAVEALTTQFYGTAAAAEAQMWLGDRALAQGDAPRAEGHYQAARSELPPDADLATVAARLRLAAAMQGRNTGDPPTTSMKLGAWTLSPAEFERTVQELRARAPEQEAGPRSASGVAVNQITSPLPPPSRFTLKPFAKLDGDVGRNPEQVPRRDVDFLGPQISTTFSAGRMIVSNRFQVLSLNVSDGKPAWRTSLGNEQGRTHSWSRVPMPPVVVDGRIFVRRLTAAGPELACLEETSGRVVWRSPRGEVVASDALVAGDRVQAVVLATPQQETLEAVLTTFELRTGKVLSRRPLVMLRDYWKRELPVKLTPAGDVLLMQMAGCVIGCSPEGELRWLRRLPWLPTSLVAWSQSAAVGDWVEFAEGRLTVQGLLNDKYDVDIRTGAVQLHNRIWYGSGRDRQEAGEPRDRYASFRRMVHGGDRFGVFNQEFNHKLWRPRAFWSSVTTGEIDAAWPMLWQKTRPSVGPLASYDGRYFAFVTNDLKNTTRDIVELVPQEPLDVESPDLGVETFSACWLTQVPTALRDDDPFAVWDLVQSKYEEKLWQESKLFLEDDCRLTYATPSVPAVWSRTVALPAGSPMKLKLQTAAAGASAWRLEVRIDGQSVLERTVEAAAAGVNAWRDDVVDLDKYAGRKVQITLIHHALSPPKGVKLGPAAWRRMTIVEK